MDGLVPGRVVYFVFDEGSAQEVMRRRTTGKSIADRIKMLLGIANTDQLVPYWPLGAQAHIGNDVHAGDVCPAVVVKVLPYSETVNLKVMLDGTDVYWATSVGYDAAKSPRSWFWMFEGQDKRYTPDRVQATS